MLEILIPISFISTVLLVWFKTEAFEEYSTLFGFGKFFKVEEFRKARQRNPVITYHDHLLNKYDSFFLRLITCPYCLGFWLTLAVCVHKERFDPFGFYYLGGISLYALTYKVTEE